MSMIFQFCVTPKISQSIIDLTVVIAIIPYDLSRLSDDKYNNMKFIYNFSDFNKFDYSKYTETSEKVCQVAENAQNTRFVEPSYMEKYLQRAKNRKLKQNDWLTFVFFAWVEKNGVTA